MNSEDYIINPVIVKVNYGFHIFQEISSQP